jgi:hypothetical protein
MRGVSGHIGPLFLPQNIGNCLGVLRAIVLNEPACQMLG